MTPRPRLSPESRIALGPPTRDALDRAKGRQGDAARLLGIGPMALVYRLRECTVPAWGDTVSLRSWLDRRWPQRGGHRATPVLSWRVEKGERIYVLGCGPPGAPHVNRVPAVGKVRERVVCQTCKEARTE